MTAIEIKAFIRDWLKPMRTSDFKMLEPLLDVVLKDPRFEHWPASKSGKHHGYYGGLSKHTGEVLVNLRRMGETRPELDQLVMAVAGTWHDMGKMEEYIVYPSKHADGELDFVGLRQNPPLASHITIGLVERAKHYQGCLRVITSSQHKHITHCIASHHGKLAWGSPVVPRTMEALLLHHADVQSVMQDTGNNPEDRYS